MPEFQKASFGHQKALGVKEDGISNFKRHGKLFYFVWVFGF
jgi:hypothetical protein